ncbi:MAG: hypothetical protein ABEI52_04605 [Halobacteriaceae archaeon]
MLSEVRLLDIATVCLAGSLTLYTLGWSRIHTGVSHGGLVFFFGMISPVAAVVSVKFFGLYQTVQIISSVLAIAMPVVIGIAMINLLIRGELA